MMANFPIVFVIDLAKAAQPRESTNWNGDKEWVFAYKIPRDLVVGPNCYIRLVTYLPPTTTSSKPRFILLTNFTKKQYVNGRLEGILAVYDYEFSHSNAFVPLAGNYIPATGDLTISTIPGFAAVTKPEGRFVFEVADSKYAYT